MTTELEDQSLRDKRNTYMRNYMRERKRGTFNMVIKPTTHMKLRSFYEDYVIKCQQSHYIPVKFQYFVTEFAEIGYMNWKEKNK